jgi:superfamily II DNA or RNA helicase
LVKQFAEKGYNFVSISYKETSEFKKEVIEDFSRPDTEIHGLIATDILTRGFDVPDVMIGVSARPFSKSLSSHIQQMGRVMRPSPDKEFALWLDHSGNYIRFRNEWEMVYQDGVKELDESQVEHAHKEPTEREKKEAKCPSCSALWEHDSEECHACGYVRKKKQFMSIAGEMHELGMNGRDNIVDRQQFFSELLYVAKNKNYNPNWASHKYREKYGVWPKDLEFKVEAPTINTMNWIKHRMIAYSKANKKDRKVA